MPRKKRSDAAALAALRAHNTDLVRLHALAIRAHRLGPRILYELATEIARRTGDLPSVTSLLEELATIDPRLLRVAGGDVMPVLPLRAIPLGPGRD